MLVNKSAGRQWKATDYAGIVERCDDTKMVASVTAKTSCSSPGVV